MFGPHPPEGSSQAAARSEVCVVAAVGSSGNCLRAHLWSVLFVPPNQKHAGAFTYEPPRISQECITSGARGQESKKVQLQQATAALPFVSTSRVGALSGGAEISGRVRTIKAEDQKHRKTDSSLNTWEMWTPSEIKGNVSIKRSTFILHRFFCGFIAARIS